MSISRRTFLVGAAGGVLVLGGAAERATTWERRETVDGWAARITRSPSARDLGLEYVTRVPEENSEQLLRTLMGLVSPLSLLGGLERRAAGFYEQHRRDFEQGDLLRMGGWMLSRTELRLCALAMLEHQKTTQMQGVFAPMTLRGETYEWTAPSASMTVKPGAEAIEFQIKRGSPAPQRVSIHLAGVPLDALELSDNNWRPIRYVVRHADSSPVTLEIQTEPAWHPAWDYRTLGVAVKRMSGFAGT